MHEASRVFRVLVMCFEFTSVILHSLIRYPYISHASAQWQYGYGYGYG